MTNRPKIGISACLLGNAVRFDGGHKRAPFLTNILGQFVEWLPICPEVELGMTIPREPVRLIASRAGTHMIAERSGKDWTDEMNDFARARTTDLVPMDLSGYIFKKNSPTCGFERVRIYNSKGVPTWQGRGLFAAAVVDRFPLMPAEEEGRLQDPVLRESFIERVFAYHRWQILKKCRSMRALIEFHTQHKFLLLAHSERHYRRLGRMVAAAADSSLVESLEIYGAEFMKALAVHANAKKHSNVLEHMLGYFSKELSTDERKEVTDLIEEFRRQIVPLIAPITLMRHYEVRRYLFTGPDLFRAKSKGADAAQSCFTKAFGALTMKSYQLKTEIWLPKPRDEVFEFFADPANLESLTPGWLRLEMITKVPGAIKKGIRLDYRLRVHGVPIKWQSEISEWEPPHRFIDQQTRGPYRLWVHEHNFIEHHGGTLVGDNVQYAVPGGILVQKFIVAPDLDRIFKYRHMVLQTIFNSENKAARQSAPLASI